MTQKHVAKSGASAGQWVTCNAKQSCRNGGRHISSETLKEISQRTYTPVKEITEADVENYHAEQKPSNQPQDVQPHDEYLIQDDSLSIKEKREELNKQLSLANRALGPGYTIERNSTTQELICTNELFDEKSKIVFSKDGQSSRCEIVKYEYGLPSEKTVTRYNEDGERHGNGQPAYISTNPDRIETCYYENGEFHRDGDQPAYISNATEREITIYYKNGKAHREGDKPASILKLHSEGGRKIIYYKNGLIHRDGDKPALIVGNIYSGQISKTYSIDGNKIKETSEIELNWDKDWV